MAATHPCTMSSPPIADARLRSPRPIFYLNARRIRRALTVKTGVWQALAPYETTGTIKEQLRRIRPFRSDGAETTERELAPGVSAFR